MKATTYIDKKQNDLYALGDLLFKTPELGYKEFETKRILTDFFTSNGLEVKDLGFETAFSVTIGKGKPHIGLVAELDGIPTLGHKYANKKDMNAAHSCGHSTQCAIMAYAIVALKNQGIDKGTVTLFFTPGEEYTDIAYRKKLIREKKLKYIGGKSNLLASGAFDDIDMFIHLHTMSEGKYDYSLGSMLTGFIHKTITFKGKASHAAVAPEKGINALDEFVSFYNELNELKNSFSEEDKTIIHGIVIEGGQSVNSVPERVVYECYVRSKDSDVLIDTGKKVDAIARKAARKYGGKVRIETMPGYLPLIQSKELNEVIEKEMLRYSKNIRGSHVSMAAGDVGDIGSLKPLVQFGYSGFKGTCHSKDLCVGDYSKAYLEPCKIVCGSVNALLKDDKKVKEIIENFKPLMNKKEYMDYLNNKR